MEMFTLLGPLLTATANLFIAAPIVAVIPAVFFAFGFRRTRRVFLLVTAILWTLYVFYEGAIKLKLICSGECNIRVDLLLIYPLLLVTSILALVLLLKWKPNAVDPETHAKANRFSVFLKTIASLVCLFYLIKYILQLLSLYNLLPIAMLIRFPVPILFYGISLVAFSLFNNRSISIVAAVAGVLLLVMAGFGMVNMLLVAGMDKALPALYNAISTLFVLTVLWLQIKRKKADQVDP